MSPSSWVTASNLRITGRSPGNDHDNTELTIDGIITRSGTYKAPEKIRDYVDPSQCVERSEATRETLCVKTMGEMYRSVDINEATDLL